MQGSQLTIGLIHERANDMKVLGTAYAPLENRLGFGFAITAAASIGDIPSGSGQNPLDYSPTQF
jgi:hypothetical protein